MVIIGNLVHLGNTDLGFSFLYYWFRSLKDGLVKEGARCYYRMLCEEKNRKEIMFEKLLGVTTVL